MISYYQLKKNGKKSSGCPKIRSKLSKMRKFGTKIGIICILTQKNTQKNYKMKLIKNKEGMISYYQLKKNGKKSRGGPKIRSKLSKMRKIW